MRATRVRWWHLGRSVAVGAARARSRSELGVLRRRLERAQADLETARRVIEVQGNVSALLEELLAKGASETNDGQPQR